MAEAAVAEPRPHRFYCHQCSVEVNPTLPDFTCPNCENGFVEEITDNSLYSRDFSGTNAVEQDPAAQFAELWGRAFVESFRAHAAENERQNDTNPESANVDEALANLHDRTTNRARIRPLFPRTRVALSRTGSRGERHPVIDNIVTHLLGSLSGGPVIPTIGMFNIHGNPDDYAWGAGGLDSIITQLLNQLEGTGAPPADRERIEALPTVIITTDQVDKVLQCSVCMEDFKVDERVRQLPCQHCYHTDCIVPWLQMHGTCPVCRKDLSGEDTTTKEYPLPGSSSDPGSGTSGDI